MQRIDDPSHIPANVTRAGSGGPWTLRCNDCHMIFGEPTLLQKHKERFCVGSQLGDPDALMLRRQLRDPDRPPDHVDQQEEETPRQDPSQNVKVLELAQHHGKQMEFLKNRNKELEEQREAIRRQLEALAQRQHPAKDNAPEELLKELREEEEKSRRQLEELRRQLAEARRPVNTIPSDEPETERKTYNYPIMPGGSLVAEIMLVRQTYMSNGGNDPDILNHLEQLLTEARALEDSLKNTGTPRQLPREKDDSQLISVELENKRLLEQLIQLQEQKIMNKKRNGGREDELEHELRRLRRDHLRQMQELQLQMERLRQDSQMDRLFLELQLRNQVPAVPPPPTKLILKQRPRRPPQPPPHAPQAEPVDPDPPYDDDPSRYHLYGHTWVHTHHRQENEEDPDFDLDL